MSQGTAFTTLLILKQKVQQVATVLLSVENFGRDNVLTM
jgi:hypothetical protein